MTRRLAVALASSLLTAAAFVPSAAKAAAAFVPELQIGDAVPASPLRDQRGRAFTLASLRGEAVVVSFIFTRCRDRAECPLTSAKFAELQRRTSGLPIRLVEVTIDPSHDTPRVLAQYGAAFGADPSRWSLATGTKAGVADLLARFGVVARANGAGDFTHSELVDVVDRDGRLADRVDGTAWTPDEILASARDAAGLGADPLLRAALALRRGIASACGGGTSGVSYGTALVLIALLTAGLGIAAARIVRAAYR